MNNFYKFLTRISPKQKIIFDLDKTLWNTTIEFNKNIKLYEIRSKIHPNTYHILESFLDNGNSLNIPRQKPLITM